MDREEFINAGVILFCKERRFLKARVLSSGAFARVMASSDIDLVQLHLAAFTKYATPTGSGPHCSAFPGRAIPLVGVTTEHDGSGIRRPFRVVQDPEIALERLFQQLVTLYCDPRPCQYVARPPLTSYVWPVTNEQSGLARK